MVVARESARDGPGGPQLIRRLVRGDVNKLLSSEMFVLLQISPRILIVMSERMQELEASETYISSI